MRVCVYVLESLCVCVCVCVCMCVCVYTCMHACVYAWVHTHACVCVCSKCSKIYIKKWTNQAIKQLQQVFTAAAKL